MKRAVRAKNYYKRRQKRKVMLNGVQKKNYRITQTVAVQNLLNEKAQTHTLLYIASG